MLFLQLNGYDLVVDDTLLTDFTLGVASADYSLEQVQDWLGAHIQPLV